MRLKSTPAYLETEIVLMVGRKNNSGRTAASLLATCYVFACGVLVCAFISFAFSHDPRRPLLWGGAISLCGFLLLSLLFRRRENRWLEGGYYWLLGRRPDESPEYTPRLIKPKIERFGTNAPPTVEQLRETAEQHSLNTWVPAKTARRRER